MMPFTTPPSTYSNHLIVATRTSGGKLHLVANVGKVPLNDATLIEDPTEQVTQDDDGGEFEVGGGWGG